MLVDFFRSVAAFVVAIGVLVAFHEFGHFWVARRFGIKVLRFSVGFAGGAFKPLWQWRGRDGVEYQIGSIPLGGYVKLLDEREGPVAEAELPRAFNRQPVGVRIAVFAAGPAFNFLLAVLFYWALYAAGIPDIKPLLGEPGKATPAAAAGLHEGDEVVALDQRSIAGWDDLHTAVLAGSLFRDRLGLAVKDRAGTLREVSLDLRKVRVDPQYLFEDLGLQPYEPPLSPVLGRIVPGGPADQAGLKSGDRVLSIDGNPVVKFQQLHGAFADRGGQVVKLEVQRGQERVQVSVIPGPLDNGKAHYVGIGVERQQIAADEELWHDLQSRQQYGPVTALRVALRKTGDMTVLVVGFLYRMVLGDISIKNIGGPINTAQAAGYSASIGLSAFLGFVAFVSLNLGIVNLLPVPLLDGGQILYGLVELVKGSPLSERAQTFGMQIGLTLLVLLMGLAFYNDLARLIG
ncbi:MAG: RIP metalloprotease RseP [Nevskia sp.]|nr:RIP metalloprotease RseP [Nevskia sp.]